MTLRNVRLSRRRTVPLHDRLTVVAGLGDDRRAEVAAALATAARPPGGTPIDIVLRRRDLPPVAAGGTQGGDAELAAAADHARAQERAVGEDLDAARRDLDPEAHADKAAAEAVVAGAEADLDAARTRLHEAENAVRALDERQSDTLRRRTELERRRADVAADLEEAERLDSDAVADALVAYRRLQSVKPRPSPTATLLADRWAAYRARLAGELAESEPPPEYLVAPARAALDSARAAVEEAERAGQVEIDVDPAAVEELERVHRRVLEAEQRANLRPSRLSRRRLEGARRAEVAALTRLGVADYGDYLRRIVPVVRAGSKTNSLAEARDALADAEAVWDELHGGVPPMPEEQLRAAIGRIREEAVELLGEDPGDDALEDRLRSHVETVVDVEWTRDALIDALSSVGIEVVGDPEPFAEDWLSGAPERRARVRELERALAEIDEEMARLPAASAEDAAGHQGQAGEHGGAAGQAEDAVGRAAAEVEEREARLAEARDRQQEAAARVTRAEEAEKRVAGLTARVAEAQATTAAADQAAADQAAADQAAAQDDAAAASLRPVEVLLYSLARLAAHRAAPSGVVPVVVDDAYTALPDGARAYALDLLARVSGVVPVVYLTSSDAIATWAEALPEDQRLVHRR